MASKELLDGGWLIYGIAVHYDERGLIIASTISKVPIGVLAATKEQLNPG